MQKRVLLDERFVELLAKAGSEPDETLHMGIRARVRTVNVQQGFVVVMDDEDQKTERFGDNCILDCKKAEQDGFIIYVTDGTRTAIPLKRIVFPLYFSISSLMSR